jgi:6,7-dimethyl-8-ribityllumazine synthase
VSNPDIDESSENVLSSWPRRPAEPEPEAAEPAEDEVASWVSSPPEAEAEAVAAPEPELEDAELEEPEPEEPPLEEPDEEPEDFEDDSSALTVEPSTEHAAGELEIPEGYAVLEGVPDGGRRAVGVVVARFNGKVTSRLLASALEELDAAGVRREAITVMVVPGAFELPVAATALAKTRRFACIVALGCIIRGDTPHFDYVASEAASGIQLAALETGVPCSFGVLTLDRVEQAEGRVEKGAEAVRSALEMADVFSHLRAAAAR